MRVTVIDNPKVRVRRWVAAVAVSIAALVVAPQAFADDAADGVAFTDTYVVSEGETLWSIATAMTPEGGDVYDTIGTIKSMNMLDSSSIRAGEQLLVPVQG